MAGAAEHSHNMDLTGSFKDFVAPFCSAKCAWCREKLLNGLGGRGRLSYQFDCQTDAPSVRVDMQGTQCYATVSPGQDFGKKRFTIQPPACLLPAAELILKLSRLE